ncbi:MAG: exonuclease SbcCD subunit D C-terminal domain-containing protein [Bacteroidales bacterium]|nr:exonuclease SbcCD subunit D C-terminal domain-containing protein [Bacteroidales bacterium]
MMKLLHTSDWHLGQTFCNYDRMDEHRHFMSQLADIVRAEQPDAMVVAGDIFNVPTPSASALRLFTDGLLEICRQAPQMDVFVTAGNHDSANRLEADRELWLGYRVRVHGVAPSSPETVANYVHHVEGKGVFVAIPYFSPRNVDEKVLFAAADEFVRQVNTDGLPVVYMAHAAVSGSDTTGHDDAIGGMEMEPLSNFGTEYDYLALGHIHCPQKIKGSDGRARYCGTPVAVSFDETYPHGVDIVTLTHGQAPEVRPVRIEPRLPMLTIPRSPKPFDDALAELSALPGETEAYVRLNVLVDDYLPSDAQLRAMEVVKEKACRFCNVKLTHRERIADTASTPTLHLMELKEMDPVEVARIRWREEKGKEMDAEIVKLLQGVVDEVRNPDK